MSHPKVLTRRVFLRSAVLAAGALALGPTAVLAKRGDKPGGPPGGDPPPSGLIDPYAGVLPGFAAPLAAGTYTVADNWHAARQGSLYEWNHRNAKTRRAHDGADLFPADPGNLSAVLAPVTGTIAAVCRRSDNTLDANVSYEADADGPPWDYSGSIDTVDALPLYGNFVWTRTDAGYFVFLCHLATGSIPTGIAAGTRVEAGDFIATMGDTGNAVGAPQLHVEIHYPAGTTFGCSRCRGPVSLTAINPYPTLLNASPV